MRLFIVVLHLGRYDGFGPVFRIWSMFMGGVRVMKSYFLTNFNVECLRMKVQVVFGVGNTLSRRNDVPGSCSTLSKALARSEDMSRSLDPDSCSSGIGDSSGDRIASLAGCIT